MISLRSILVLCEGNHCRSPLAEALLRRELGDSPKVTSAGFRALVGSPPDAELTLLAEQVGISMTTHRGRALLASEALEADLILVMSETQRAECADRIPASRGRIFLLGQWLDTERREIPDPFRKGPEAMLASIAHIQAAVTGWLPRIKTLRKP